LVLVDQIVKVGNDVIDRAAVMAVGDTAIHTSRTLLARLVVGQGNDKFLEIVDAFPDGLIRPVLAGDFHESSWFAHLLLPSYSHVFNDCAEMYCVQSR